MAAVRKLCGLRLDRVPTLGVSLFLFLLFFYWSIYYYSKKILTKGWYILEGDPSPEELQAPGFAHRTL